MDYGTTFHVIVKYIYLLTISTLMLNVLQAFCLERKMLEIKIFFSVDRH